MRKIRRAQSPLQKKDNEDGGNNTSEVNLKESLILDPDKMQRSNSNFTNEDDSRDYMRRSKSVDAIMQF
jgi:hypothetical protein